MKSPDEDSSCQRAVLILGAGRSGTSIVTRGLQATGIELGNDFKPPSRKNPTGFFEDTTLLRLSKKLRRTLGLRPDSLRLLDDSVWSSPKIMPYYEAFSAAITDRFGHAPVWGFKYGRTMRLLPFWERLFEKMNIAPSYVMPIRNPLSVARSRAKLDGRRGQQENSDLEWLVNVLPYFDQVRGGKLAVVDYDRLMQDPVTQLERLATQLDLPSTDQTQHEIQRFANEFLKPSLQHTRFSVDDLKAAKNINVLVRDAYTLLDRLANDEISAASADLWHDWATIRARVFALGPLLARLDVLNSELRHAQWNPLSPISAAWQAVHWH